MMKLSDFSYELPDELIARYPLAKRRDSRLLCLNSQTGKIEHKHFSDIYSLLQPNDLLVCNNTRVIPARLFGHKQTGGRIEVLIERILDSKQVLAHVRASKSPHPNARLIFSEDIEFVVLGRRDDLFVLSLPENDTRSMLEVIEKIGEIPLPPYMHRAPEESDKERYQTIFAEHKGSVAAPTAGLHFDLEMMEQLRTKGIDIGYVTLHIGAGTFAPVRVEDIQKHRMHSEYIEVSHQLCEQVKKTKQNGGRIVAVGTTSARCLETASRSGEIQSFSGDTDIFIYPGFQFQCVDALITNLHLPGSTLLMLVSALGGYENMMEAYRQAVEQKYRFFSYGDAMFISNSHPRESGDL